MEWVAEGAAWPLETGMKPRREDPLGTRQDRFVLPREQMSQQEMWWLQDQLHNLQGTESK